MTIAQVVIDAREPAHVRRLTFGGLPVEASTQLDAGDIWALTDDAAIVAIERKTVSDLANTLRDDRLFGQISRLRALTPWAYLLVSGVMTPLANGGTAIDGRSSAWDYNALQGALLTVQELGVHVVTIAGDHEIEAAVLRLANRTRGDVRIDPVRRTVQMSEQEAILVGFPGIGSDKAQAILGHCGTAAWALTALTTLDSKLSGVGVGQTIRHRVRRALGLRENEVLHVVEAAHATDAIGAPVQDGEAA